MNEIRDMTIEEVVAEEVQVLQDIVGLKPYYKDFREVPPAMGYLSSRRKELRKRWVELNSQKQYPTGS